MLEIIIIALMLLVNAVFAAYELALASISKNTLASHVAQKTRGAAAAMFMKEHMEGSLALVQLAITLAGAVAAATGGTGVGEYLAPWLAYEFGLRESVAEFFGVVLFVLPFSAFTIVFSELVPKMFAIEYNAGITLLLSPAVRVFYWGMYPVIALFEKTVKAVMRVFRRFVRPAQPDSREAVVEELRAATAYARSRNVIGLFEERIANSAVLFSRKTVRDAMIPAGLVSCVPADVSLNDALVRAHMDMHTRFPVVEKDGDLQTVIGYLNFKDIVSVLRMSPFNPTVKGITRPVKRINTARTLPHVLQEMIAENTHMAVVTDSHAILGIITLEDIIELLVGKIADEYDSLPVYIHNSGSSLLAGGGTAVSAVCAALKVPFEEADRPLSQWAEEKQGKPLRGGDIIRACGLEVWVRKTRRRHLMEAVVMRLPAQPSGK